MALRARKGFLRPYSVYWYVYLTESISVRNYIHNNAAYCGAVLLFRSGVNDEKEEGVAKGESSARISELSPLGES